MAAAGKSGAQPTSAQLRALQKRLGVEFRDVELLRTAVVHRSYLGESTGLESNERLEFLGDSVLGLVISSELFEKMQGRSEGDLSKAKAVAVSEPVLADAAKPLGLHKVMLLSTGERLSGGYERASILSDMYEAIVAAIYLDHGLETAREFILRTLSGILDQIALGSHLRDHKSLLQTMVQGVHKSTPRYIVTDQTGADHDKTFTVQVEVGGEVLGSGTGKSKKQAEQLAARHAVEKLGEDAGKGEGS